MECLAKVDNLTDGKKGVNRKNGFSSTRDDVVFLQLKQARRSVLARFVHGDSAWHAHQGQRVVEYQQASAPRDVRRLCRLRCGSLLTVIEKAA